MKRYLQLTLILAFLISFQSVARAQAAGAELTGEVKDTTGAFLPHARINITQTGTGQTNTITVTDGSYAIGNLRPGLYNFTVEAAGFKQMVREGVRLATGERVRLDFVLEPGALSESVMIKSDAPLLRSETGSLGQVISQRKIVDLPGAPNSVLGTPGFGSITSARGSCAGWWE